MEYADYLREKYNISDEEDSPSTADVSAFTDEMDLYVDEPPEMRPKAGSRGINAADRLSRNRAARRAVTDVTTYNHISTLYHMNRRIQEMYSKSDRRRRPPARSVGYAYAADLEDCNDRSRPATSCRPGSAYRPGPHLTPRIYGAPQSPPSPSLRPASAPFGGPERFSSQRTAGNIPAAYPCSSRPEWDSRPSTAATATQGRHQRPMTAAGRSAPSARNPMPGQISPSRAGAASPYPASYTERRVKNSAQALKTAILNEIIENRIYEEQRLKVLFRSYLKLNSGEAFYPTLVNVIAELKQELGCL